MNIDRVLQSLAKNEVNYLFIGGVNFLLRHAPEITYDIDVWIADKPKNLERTVSFLKSINAEWGATEDDWKPVPDTTTWLTLQPVFCLTSPIAAIDISGKLRGLKIGMMSARQPPLRQRLPAASHFGRCPINTCWKPSWLYL